MPSILLQNKCVTGDYRGLINSRNISQKFDSSSPSQWFSNANLCGGNDIWQEYAELHKSMLSEKKNIKFLVYDCTDGICGGYGNRISGITVLLVYAMLTKRALLLKMTRPVDINSYFLPKAIEWNHPVPAGLRTQNINLMDTKHFIPNFKMFEAAVFSDQYDVVSIKINFGLFYFLTKMNDESLHNMISMLHIRTHYDLVLLYGCAFNYLFKYQPKVINTIDALQSDLGLETGKFVALHIRSRIGDTYHPFRLKFEPLIECAAIAARTLSHKLNVSNVPIYLATDHPIVTQYATEHYGDSIILSRAPKFHIDFASYKGNNASQQYDNGMMGLLSDVEICSRGSVLIRSLCSTMSEVMGAIHFLSPQKHLHPFYFYNNLSACQL